MRTRQATRASVPEGRSFALSFLLRVVVLALVLGGFAHHYANELVDALLPAFRAEINWLDDTYRIDQLFSDTEGADRVVRIVVGLAHCVVLPDGAHCGDPRGLANASTLAGNVTLAGTLLLVLALAWPASQAREYGWRLLCLTIALPLLWALDIPFILWAALWSLHVDMFAPDLFSPLLIWSQFMQGGGRLALATLLAGAAVAASKAISERRWHILRRMDGRADSTAEDRAAKV